MKAIDESKTISVTNDRYRLKYHVMTPFGWMNDPNGFSYFIGYYHLFYQYNPYSAEWGPMHWGITAAVIWYIGSRCRSPWYRVTRKMRMAATQGARLPKTGNFM